MRFAADEAKEAMSWRSILSKQALLGCRKYMKTYLLDRSEGASVFGGRGESSVAKWSGRQGNSSVRISTSSGNHCWWSTIMGATVSFMVASLTMDGWMDGSKDVSEVMDGWRGAVLSVVLRKNGIQFQKCFSPSCRPKRQVGLRANKQTRQGSFLRGFGFISFSTDAPGWLSWWFVAGNSEFYSHFCLLRWTSPNKL